MNVWYQYRRGEQAIFEALTKGLDSLELAIPDLHKEKVKRLTDPLRKRMDIDEA
ncbi:MAG: hypothetical protein ACFCD0_26365 [Gemmataceae bacterium]